MKSKLKGKMKTELPGFGCSPDYRYVKGVQIGKGAYGTVYKAKDTYTNTEVALKKCAIDVAMHR